MNTPRIATLIYSFQCPALCGHCLYQCAPSRKSHMGIPEAQRVILEIARAGIPYLNLSGGEPMLFYKDIIQLAVFARIAGLRVTLTTNGYWATSLQTALKKISALKKSGIELLRLSADDFHLREIPINRIENIILAARKHALAVTLLTVRNTKGTINTQVANILTKHRLTHEEGTIIPLGRASALLRAPHTFKSTPACRYIKQTITITPQKKILACCCIPQQISPDNPLFLGDLNHTGLRQILQRRNARIFSLLQQGGPRLLYQTLRSKIKDATKTLPEQMHKCAFCFKFLNSEAAQRLYGGATRKKRKTITGR